MVFSNFVLPLKRTRVLSLKLFLFSVARWIVCFVCLPLDLRRLPAHLFPLPHQPPGIYAGTRLFVTCQMVNCASDSGVWRREE